MGTDIPKQFLTIDYKPIIVWTIEAFFRFHQEIRIVVTLPAERHRLFQRECMRYFSEEEKDNIVLATGGLTRTQSVYNGIKAFETQHLKDYDTQKHKCLLAVHDGVRPFITAGLIAKCYAEADLNSNAVAVVPLKQSIREITENGTKSAHRSKFVLVQTPQVFEFQLIKQCYDTYHWMDFTDDASLVESCGYPIHTVEGIEENIKITTPTDLDIADVLKKKFVL